MLKYLFTAEFADGTKIVQEPEDKSVIEPEKRSRFFDVLQYPSKLIRFSLSDGKTTHSVDLLDGHFEKDGVITKESPKLGFDPLCGFRVVFFRAHTHTFVKPRQQGVEEAQHPGMVETGHIVTYKLGWQCTVDGKNVEEVIEFD